MSSKSKINILPDAYKILLSAAYEEAYDAFSTVEDFTNAGCVQEYSISKNPLWYDHWVLYFRPLSCSEEDYRRLRLLAYSDDVEDNSDDDEVPTPAGSVITGILSSDTSFVTPMCVAHFDTNGMARTIVSQLASKHTTTSVGIFINALQSIVSSLQSLPTTSLMGALKDDVTAEDIAMFKEQLSKKGEILGPRAMSQYLAVQSNVVVTSFEGVITYSHKGMNFTLHDPDAPRVDSDFFSGFNFRGKPVEYFPGDPSMYPIVDLFVHCYHVQVKTGAWVFTPNEIPPKVANALSALGNYVSTCSLPTQSTSSAIHNQLYIHFCRSKVDLDSCRTYLKGVALAITGKQRMVMERISKSEIPRESFATLKKEAGYTGVVDFAEVGTALSKERSVRGKGPCEFAHKQLWSDLPRHPVPLDTLLKHYKINAVLHEVAPQLHDVKCSYYGVDQGHGIPAIQEFFGPNNVSYFDIKATKKMRHGVDVVMGNVLDPIAKTGFIFDETYLTTLGSYKDKFPQYIQTPCVAKIAHFLDMGCPFVSKQNIYHLAAAYPALASQLATGNVLLFKPGKHHNPEVFLCYFPPQIKGDKLFVGDKPIYSYAALKATIDVFVCTTKIILDVQTYMRQKHCVIPNPKMAQVLYVKSGIKAVVVLQTLCSQVQLHRRADQIVEVYEDDIFG